MNDDARFEDGRAGPLNLGAFDAEGLEVISALVQDAVLTGADIAWRPKERTLALLVNRLRREDGLVSSGRTAPERVRAMLVIGGALKVSSQGVAREDADTVLSVLSVGFAPSEAEGGGDVLLTLAGDGAIRVGVAALDVTLKDVTRPYRAVSRKMPDHGV